MSLRLRPALLHASAASIMAYGYLSLKTTRMDSWIREQTGGHFQFLTIQGLSIAWLTMIFSLTCDLFPSSIHIKHAKRSLLMIALPLSIVVSVTYWTLILFHPSLILQGEAKNAEPSASSEGPYRIPLSIDLSLHMVPGIALAADFFFFEKRYSNTEASLRAPTVAVLFAIWYSCWVEYCASYNGIFPYPFLDNSLEIRIIIYICATMFAIVSFRFINSLHVKEQVSP